MAKPSQTYVPGRAQPAGYVHDVDNLVGVLDWMVDAGNTVIVIEHDLDVIANADLVISAQAPATTAAQRCSPAGRPSWSGRRVR